MAKSKKVNKSAIIRKLYDEGKSIKEIKARTKYSDGLVRLVIRNYKKKSKSKAKGKAQFKSPRSRLIQEIFQTKKALDAGGVDDSGTEIKFDETGMMKEGTKVGGLTLRKLPGDLWTWKKETEADPVNHPPHYTKGGIETIDFIEAKDLNYRLGNVVKYVSRAGKKDSDPIQDLEKAAWYLQREILARKQA